MRIVVLGSAAGGGFPQWNCRCPVCTLAWQGSSKVSRRTQTSLAVSADHERFVIVDAAPELREQIINTPVLHPRYPGRDSPIAAVVLTSGDVDHLAGLLCLRENHRFDLFGTAETLRQVEPDSVFGVLRAPAVVRRSLALDVPFSCAGMTIRPFAVPGKVPLYRESGDVVIGEEGETVVGLEIVEGHRRVYYIPGCARVTASLRDRLQGADALFFDGTTFTDDEMPRLGLSSKSATRMGHLAISGEGGSLHAFDDAEIARRIYIHINNSNPILIEDSDERRTVIAAGWTVAHDGMELRLDASTA